MVVVCAGGGRISVSNFSSSILIVVETCLVANICLGGSCSCAVYSAGVAYAGEAIESVNVNNVTVNIDACFLLIIMNDW